MCHIFIIKSITDRHLAWFWVCYCKQWCSEHMCACVFIVERFIILWVYTHWWDFWVKCYFCFEILEESSHCLHNGCTNLHSHQQCKIIAVSPHSLQHLLSPDFLMITILTGARWSLNVVLICTSLMTSHDEHFVTFLGHINVFFWEVSAHILLLLFDEVVCFFLVNLFTFLVDSGYLPFVRWIDCQNFLPFCKLPAHSYDSFFCCAETL